MIALVGMAFFAVIREGFETAVFMLAAFQSSTDPTAAGFGAVLGVLVGVPDRLGDLLAAACGSTWRGSSGSPASSSSSSRPGCSPARSHTAHEAGWLSTGQAQAVDLSWFVVPGTWTASLLTGMLGLQPRPTVSEAAAYLVYAVPMGLYVLWPRSAAAPPRCRRPLRPRGRSIVLAALALAACGSSSAALQRLGPRPPPSR